MHLLLVLLTLCCLSTCRSDGSWDYSSVKSKAEAASKATGQQTVVNTISSTIAAQLARLGVAAAQPRAAKTNTSSGQSACGDAMFDHWAAAFNYAFVGPARLAALKQFCINMEQVKKINSNLSISFWTSGNAYSHLSMAQFAKRYLANLTVKARDPKAVNTPTPTPAPSRKLLAASDVPKAYVNWVEQGKVTPIRNQAGCSSCWAFAAVSVIESAYLMARGGNASDPAMHLSEQQLVSCVSAANGYQSHGCTSGLTDEAIDYVADHDLTLASLYPYTAAAGTCNASILSSVAAGKAVKLSKSHLEVPWNDESAMISAVESAPTAVYFAVDYSFVQYAGGIYTPLPSNTNQVNHAVILVGYNTTTSARHWLVRNHWGTAWGEKGYARVKMTGAASDGVGPCGMYQYGYQAPAQFSSPPLQLPSMAAGQITGNKPTKQSPPALNSTSTPKP